MIYTDHEPLKYIETQPHVSSRQARWLERLSELTYSVQYIPGRENIPADVLSRYGQGTPVEEALPLYDTDDVSL